MPRWQVALSRVEIAEGSVELPEDMNPSHLNAAEILGLMLAGDEQPHVAKGRWLLATFEPVAENRARAV